jgi:gluconokinase
MKKRKGHFMPPALLDSQFATLERPSADEHATVLDISHTVPSLVAEAVRSVTAEAAAT